LTLCALGVALWAARDLAASVALRANAGPAALPEPSGRTLLVTGATGFLGEALVRRRLAAGDCIFVLSRDPKRASALFGGKVIALADFGALPNTLLLDGVINLAGAGVANAPWTAGRKRQLLASRLGATRALEALMARLHVKPKVLVSASAVGFYGNRGDEVLSEGAAAGVGFTSELCVKWEAAARAAGAHALRTVLVRFGLVFGRDAGAWPRMTLPLLLKLAVRFGGGRQWMAWIHKHDAISLIETALDDARCTGIINAVAPSNLRHRDVVAEIAKAGRAWATLTAPAWALRLGLGEMAALFLDSQRVRPAAALALGFAFRFPDIESASENLLGRGEAERAAEGSAPVAIG
jgi:uncharacterized protein (TIGR01777 family)